MIISAPYNFRNTGFGALVAENDYIFRGDGSIEQYGDLISVPDVGTGSGIVSVDSGASPATIAIYTAGGILLAGLVVFGLVHKKK
jgi:hypothetical protein